ncbi:DUF6434 domain-containing protein [Amphritea opalescens]
MFVVFCKACAGAGFTFNRAFMAWIKDGKPKTMGEVALEWQRRHQTE